MSRTLKYQHNVGYVRLLLVLSNIHRRICWFGNCRHFVVNGNQGFQSLRDEDVFKCFSNKTASPSSIICTCLPFQWYVICSEFNVLLKDSLAEKVFTVTGIYTLTFKLTLTALLTFSMPSIFHSFVRPVPTDEAVISTPDKTASLCIRAGAEGGNFMIWYDQSCGAFCCHSQMWMSN